MKFKKACVCAALAAVTALSLTACSGYSAEDATVLVKGNLDIIYLGEYTDAYLKSVNATEAEAQEIYQNNLEGESDYFLYYYDMEEVSDELYQEVVELQKEIYSHAQYEVLPATKQSDGTFAVKVTFQPIDIHVQVDEEWDDFINAFNASYADVDPDAMSDEEWEAFWPAYNDDYNRQVIELVRSKLPTLGYGEEESVVIQVAQDEDGYYTPDDNGLSSFDTLLITY